MEIETLSSVSLIKPSSPFFLKPSLNKYLLERQKAVGSNTHSSLSLSPLLPFLLPAVRLPTKRSLIFPSHTKKVAPQTHYPPSNCLLIFPTGKEKKQQALQLFAQTPLRELWGREPHLTNWAAASTSPATPTSTRSGNPPWPPEPSPTPAETSRSPANSARCSTSTSNPPPPNPALPRPPPPQTADPSPTRRARPPIPAPSRRNPPAHYPFRPPAS